MALSFELPIGQVIIERIETAINPALTEMEPVSRNSGDEAKKSALFCAPKPTILHGILHYYCIFCLGVILAFAALTLVTLIQKTYDFEFPDSLEFEWRTVSSNWSMSGCFLCFFALCAFSFMALAPYGAVFTLMISCMIFWLMSAVPLPLPPKMGLEIIVAVIVLIGYAALHLPPVAVLTSLFELILSDQAQHLVFSLSSFVPPTLFALLVQSQDDDLISNGIVISEIYMFGVVIIALLSSVLTALLLTQLDHAVVSGEIGPVRFLFCKIGFIVIANMILFVAIGAKENETVNILVASPLLGVALSKGIPAVVDCFKLNWEVITIGLAGGAVLAHVSRIVLDALDGVNIKSIVEHVAMYLNMTTAAMGAVAIAAIVLLVRSMEN